jgi:hypothetical protein
MGGGGVYTARARARALPRVPRRASRVMQCCTRLWHVRSAPPMLEHVLNAYPMAIHCASIRSCLPKLPAAHWLKEAHLHAHVPCSMHSQLAVAHPARWRRGCAHNRPNGAACPPKNHWPAPHRPRPGAASVPLPPTQHQLETATLAPVDATHFGGVCGVEGAYTQQGRAHSRRLHPDWAARPALMTNEPGGPRRRKQSRGPHRSRRKCF